MLHHTVAQILIGVVALNVALTLGAPASEDNFDLEAREESSQELSRRTPIHLGLLPGRFQEQRRDISSEELVGREETSELETREPKKKKAKILGRKRIQKGKAGPKKGKGKGKKGGRKAKILSYKRKGPWRGRRRDRRDLKLDQLD